MDQQLVIAMNKNSPLRKHYRVKLQMLG